MFMNQYDLIETVQKIKKQKYPQAKVIFLAGSVVRREHTPYSDLDLVVVYDDIPNAWRESFLYEAWPVEAFVHDPTTLTYFFETDCKRGFPSIVNMVNEGICVPSSTEFSKSLKQTAKHYLQKGPPPFTEEELNHKRYAITDLIDDLRAPRTRSEAIATGTLLYPLLADFWFRSQNQWSAKGKTIPRLLQKTNPEFAVLFEKSFQALFEKGDPTALIQVATDILTPFGGFFFDGFLLKAPKDWRIS